MGLLNAWRERAAKSDEIKKSPKESSPSREIIGYLPGGSAASGVRFVFLLLPGWFRIYSNEAGYYPGGTAYTPSVILLMTRWHYFTRSKRWQFTRSKRSQVHNGIIVEDSISKDKKIIFLLKSNYSTYYLLSVQVAHTMTKTWHL